jgi:hypothetical protein
LNLCTELFDQLKGQAACFAIGGLVLRTVHRLNTHFSVDASLHN